MSYLFRLLDEITTNFIKVIENAGEGPTSEVLAPPRHLVGKIKELKYTNRRFNVIITERSDLQN